MSTAVSGIAAQQFLVRFRDATHVIYTPQHNDSAAVSRTLLQELSHQSGWPVSRLVIKAFDAPWVSVSVVSGIVGGKGGFGTLLKGQSKQAGARATVDFGACRDLQGRRLRHVNDEIKLRKWRDMERRKAEGLPVDEVNEMQTKSGILHWHLMIPHWASDSLTKKGTAKLQRKWERQVKGWQSQEEKAKLAKAAKQEEYQRIVTDYVKRTTEASDAMQDSITDAVKQGLKQQKISKAKQKEAATRVAVKRKREEDDEDSDSSQPQSLCTLSGEVVVVESDEATSYQIQSKSDFCTVALVLERDLTEPDKGPDKGLWFEVKVVSGGLAQVGWAAMVEEGFRPNNDTGDGVGDDASSFAYDGSRNMKYHNGSETPYGDVQWQAGDIIGCRYNPSNGEISYSCNGSDLGVAFTTTPKRSLVPAMSCNQGEILELFVKGQDMQHMPADCVPVYDLLGSSLVDTSPTPTHKKDKSSNKVDSGSHVPEAKSVPEEKARNDSTTLKASNNGKTTQSDKNTKVAPKPAPAPKPQVEAKPLDLEDFQSIEELAELGLDRLKGALLALGVKCGGSLQERAERLFSLKGLKREEYPMKVRGKNFVV